MITDLTEGKPSKILWSFSIPMLLSVVFQQLYNIVDSIVAGKFVGAQALAAVGASYPITMIFMAIATLGTAYRHRRAGPEHLTLLARARSQE